MPPLHDEDDNESLRDTISAAFRANSDQSTGHEEEPIVREEPEGEEDSANVADRAAAPKSEKTDKGVDEAGTPRVAAESDGPDKAEEADKTLDPPARWTKKQKEWFNGLDPKFQQQLIDNDKNIQADYTRKMQEIGQERQRYQGLEEVLAPRRETWQRAGMNDTQALQSIMSYWDLAQRDPMQFIQVVAQERGIDLARMYQPSPEDIARYVAEYGYEDAEAGDHQQHHVSPQVQQRLDELAYQNHQLQQYVQQLGGTVQERQYRDMQEIEQSANNALAQFQAETDESGNPAHPFLDDVRKDMSALLRAGQANDLKEAYDRAVWGRPDLRERLLESMELRKQREMERTRQKEAAQARRAGSSVSASSSGVATPPARSEDDLPLRDIIKQAWAAAQGGDRI